MRHYDKGTDALGRTSQIPDRLIPAPKPPAGENDPSAEPPAILIVPPPPFQTARSMRPLWRDLILKAWGADPLRCPCCNAQMQPAGAVKRPELIEFFLRLYGLWEPEQSGDRLPGGQPREGWSDATSTRHRHPAAAKATLRH